MIWREMYEREREERAAAERQHAELQTQLAAIANAGPIRAMRLRREARRQLREKRSDEAEASAPV